MKKRCRHFLPFPPLIFIYLSLLSYLFSFSEFHGGSQEELYSVAPTVSDRRKKKKRSNAKMMLSKQQQHLLSSLCRSTKNASTPSPSIHLFRGGGVHVSGNKLTSTASVAFSSSKRGRSMTTRNRLNDHTNYRRDRHDAGNAIGFQIVGTVAIVAGAVSAVAMAYCEEGGEEETGTEIEFDSDYSYFSRPDRK